MEPDRPPVPVVVVRGEAVLAAEPEVADLHVTVRVRARDRETALVRCAARQEEVAAVVAAAGPAVEAVETSAVGVAPEWREHGPGDPVASVGTRVTVGRPDAVGELVVGLGRLADVAVAGPSWRLRSASPVFQEARLAAVQDAVRRARQYAAAFGAELTALLQVADEGLSAGPSPVVLSAALGAAEAAGPSLPLVPGRQEVRGAVEVRFAMSPVDPAALPG